MEGSPTACRADRIATETPASSQDVRQLAQTLITHHDAPHELPLPLLDLLELLVDSLPQQQSVETRELVVRSLRSCSTHTLEAHDRVLQAVTPLLLDSSLPLRIQAAGCVLQYSSTATSSTLRNNISIITATISNALAPFQYTLQTSTSGLGALRFVSTCLRVLNTLFAKLTPLPPEVVNTAVTLLGIWVYHRPGLAGSASPAPDRGRAIASGGALAFGVMGAFAPASPQKKSTRSMSRSSSRSSLAGWSAESEEEDGQAEKRQGSVQVRLDALTCLRTLAAHDPKALYTQWSLFLADSPYLRHRSSLINLVESDPSNSVRLRACSALNAMLTGSAAYLAIAEDRPSKASFTSLSTRLGEIVSELHLKLVSLIQSPASSRHPEYLLALLALARTLAQNSPYSRMSRQLARPLASAVLPLLKAQDTQYALAATVAVSAIARNAFSQPLSSAPLLNATEIAQQALDILSGTSDADLDVEAWALLGAAASYAEGFDLNLALDVLRAGFETAPLLVQEAQMDFIASLFKPVAPPSSDRPANPPLVLQPYATSLLRVVRVALTSERPQLRVLACGVLGSTLLAELEVERLPLEPLEEALRMLEDGEASVRAAAVRAVGMLVKTSSVGSKLPTIVSALILTCTDDEPVKSTASWSLANCCDVLTPSNIMSIDVPLVLRTALSLATPAQGDKVHANGLRAMGSLLKVVSPSSSPPLSLASLDEAAETLCHGLRTGSAKVRWNAASAIASFLSSPLLTTSPIPSLASRLLEALSSTLSSSTCPNYKVRIQATAGLLVPTERAMFGDDGDTFARVRERVKSAREELKEEEEHVSKKEVGHWRQLVGRLDRCIAHLNALAIVGDETCS